MDVLPLSGTVQQHNVSMYSYADDSELYVAFDHKHPSCMSQVMKSLECCIADIMIWMLRNRLEMKDSKTGMIGFSSLHVKLATLSVAVGGESIPSAHQLRNLGVTLDLHLTMNTHTSECVKFHISS